MRVLFRSGRLRRVFSFRRCVAPCCNGRITGDCGGLNSPEIDESLKYLPVPWTIRHWRADWTPEDLFSSFLPASGIVGPAHYLRFRLGGEGLRRRDPGSLYEAQQPPLAYLSLDVPYWLVASASLPLRVWTLRIFCCALSSLTIPIAFLTAKRMFVNEWHGLGAVLVNCAMPEFLVPAPRLLKSRGALSVRGCDRRRGQSSPSWSGSDSRSPSRETPRHR
jgi:hypothetical protein